MNNKIKLIISDLDGTLYFDGQKNTAFLPKANLEAIQRWQKAGGEFMLATGRNEEIQRYFQTAYHLQVDIIACNGGKILIKDKTLYSSEIALNKIIHLQQLLLPFGKEIDLKLDMDLPYRIALYQDGIIASLYNEEKLPIIELAEYLNQTNPPLPSKIFIPHADGSRQEFFLELLRWEFEDELTFSRSSETTLECCNPHVDKGSAVRKLIELQQLDKDTIAVIGDEENDLPMFRAVSNSFVMKHARNSVKQAAAYQIESVAELIDVLLKKQDHSD